MRRFRLAIAATTGLLVATASSVLAQQLTKETVDNMLLMCGTGQQHQEGLEGDISLLRRLGVIGGQGKMTTSEISTLIASVPDAAMKIAALQAIQNCNFHYLEMLQKRSDLQQSCISSRLSEVKTTSKIEQKNSVRCEGGGPFGNGQHKEDFVSLRVPYGFQIIGAAKININSENRGRLGEISYMTDDQGRVVGAHLPIICESPNQNFGPGAWMDVALEANIERIITPDALASIRLGCGG